MAYKLSYEEIQEARRLLEQAEAIFRKESLLLAAMVNQTHFNIIGILKDNTNYPNGRAKGKE